MPMILFLDKYPYNMDFNYDIFSGTGRNFANNSYK